MKKKERLKMKKEKRFTGKAKHLWAAALAAGMLWGVGMQADAATLKDIFDEQFYVEHNPGVAEVYGYGRESLWGHFAKHGLKEERVMNNLLDIVAYRKNNPDLEAAFGDDWDAYLNHYLTAGAKEGRDSGTEFDPMYYAGKYEDLGAAFGEDVLALWQHYMTLGKAEGREPQAPPAAADASELETEYAYRVLGRMNQYRIENGMEPLIVTRKLMDAAQLRAQEIEVLFSHDRPDGTLYLTAYDQLGINYLGGGENIAAGYRSPEAVMEGWINSPGHRGNILNRDYHYVGIGCYIGVDGRIYWTQDFMI